MFVDCGTCPQCGELFCQTNWHKSLPWLYRGMMQRIALDLEAAQGLGPHLSYGMTSIATLRFLHVLPLTLWVGIKSPGLLCCALRHTDKRGAIGEPGHDDTYSQGIGNTMLMGMRDHTQHIHVCCCAGSQWRQQDGSAMPCLVTPTGGGGKRACSAAGKGRGVGGCPF